MGSTPSSSRLGKNHSAVVVQRGREFTPGSLGIRSMYGVHVVTPYFEGAESVSGNFCGFTGIILIPTLDSKSSNEGTCVTDLHYAKHDSTYSGGSDMGISGLPRFEKKLKKLFARQGLGSLLGAPTSSLNMGVNKTSVCTRNWGTITIHWHTHVGTMFHCTVLVTAHCPALKTENSIVRIVLALASSVQGLSDLRTYQYATAKGAKNQI